MARFGYLEDMSYDSLKNMRAYNPAWKLLAAQSSSLVISFLYIAFVVDNKRAIPEQILSHELNDYMEKLNLQPEAHIAKELLTQWSDDDHGWLRKFYLTESDEIHYDLTSNAEKAIGWIVGLKPQSFVGTESRLIMVIQLLHEIAEKANPDPARRIIELEQRKKELEEEISRAKHGNIKILEPVQIKERFLQAMQMSREILSDFRLVEQNFRELNRNMRAKIAGWEKSKGELLGEFFYTHTDIFQSEQGRSFQAFFEFLMSEAAQGDFEETLKDICAMEAVKNIPISRNPQQIVQDWIKGSKHIEIMIEAISEQLRRYVDENFLEEERRINQLIKSIETSAFVLRNVEKTDGAFMQMDSITADITLPFDRPLFTPPAKTAFSDDNPVDGCSGQDATFALYSHISVNKDLLKRQIDGCLAEKEKITLADIVKAYPIKLGLAELMAYISLAFSEPNALIDVETNEQIYWKDMEGNMRVSDFFCITFSRKQPHNGDAL